jgi:hypothetical protein
MVASQQLFLSSVAPVLTASCGGCHRAAGEGAGPLFLSPGSDIYQNVVKGLIGPTPEQSKLYLRGKDNHGRVTWTSDQEKVVLAWLAAQLMQSPPTPMRPMAPMALMAIEPRENGVNVMDLSAIDPQIGGAQVTFNAREVTQGNEDLGLELSQIRVWAPTAVDLRVVHPLLVTFPRVGADPVGDASDTFAAVNMVVPRGSAALLGPGIVVSTTFRRGGRIMLTFVSVAAVKSP